MSSSDTDNLQAAVADLRATVNTLEAGETKTTVRAVSERVIDALFVCYPGLHFYLPAIED